jgi:acyl dehydratase
VIPFDVGRIGRWSDEFEHRVLAERVKAYAAATDDDNPLHASGAVSPPVFAAVPILDALWAAMDAFVPGEVRSSSVHSDQDMFFYRPLVPGMTLRTRAAIHGVYPARSGTAVAIRTQTRDAAGDLVNEGFSTLFLRGITGVPGAGDPLRDHRMPAGLRATEPLASVTDTIAEDQPARYAEASGDYSRIHLDVDYARSVGLPGVIVHGLCTMAFASRVLVARGSNGDSTRITRMAVSFARPVLPGQQITTRVWSAGPRDGRAAYAFMMLNSAGKAVLQDGLTEVAAG